MAEMRGLLLPESVADVVNPDGGGPFVLVCEHASNHVPAEFDNLGLDEAALRAHIAWDPGALAVASDLAARLDAPLVVQRVSRLLYDCNRPPESPGAVPETSEVFTIPGNRGLTADALGDRARRFYRPFRDLLAATIDRKEQTGTKPVIVTVHSFTPIYFGVRRDVEIGILHDHDHTFADLMLAAARRDADTVTRRNEPYGPNDGVTHTLREHALPRGLANVMIEIRNDLITSKADQQAMAARLAGWLSLAQAELPAGKRKERVT
jgi:predicted N-formylglutamate amidohydrolase